MSKQTIAWKGKQKKEKKEGGEKEKGDGGELNDRWKTKEWTYLRRVRLLGLVVECLRATGHGVSTGCRGAILRGADKLDSATLDDDVRGWWKILCVTERIAVAQQPSFLPVKGVDLSATVGNDALLLKGCEYRWSL